VIQDLEGATPEPSRRRHVFALSGAVAAVSLVLLVALVLPPELGVAPQVASPAASVGAARAITIVSGPTMFFPSGAPFEPPPVDERRVRECAAEPGSGASYTLVYDRDGSRVIAAFSMGRAGESPPTAPYAYGGTGWLTASCATFRR
jgi:hypothetical protein